MGDEERKRKSPFVKMQKIRDQVKAHATTLLPLMTAKILMERMQTFMKSCERVHEVLVVASVDDTAFEVQERAFEPIETLFIKITVALRTIIETLTTTASSTAGCATAALNVKLPSIELPTFDRKFADWPSLHLFNATVDNNTQLAPARKLQYLKAVLQGEPANLIKSLTITDTHYVEAKKLSRERYDNKRVIITSLINKLLNYRT